MFYFFRPCSDATGVHASRLGAKQKRGNKVLKGVLVTREHLCSCYISLCSTMMVQI